MRKTHFAISLLLVAALALAACSTPSSVNSTEEVPVIGTDTGTTLAAVTPISTDTISTLPATDIASTPVPTMGNTESVSTSPAATAAVTATATDASGTGGNTPVATLSNESGGMGSETPQAGVPQQFVRLSLLLQSDLTASNQAGQVSGVVIAEPQPETSTGTATTLPSNVQVKVPYIRYVVVNPGDNSGEMLLPWQMFAFAPVSTKPGGEMSQNFTLNGEAAARTSSPRVTLPADTAVLNTGFDSQVTEYWASQGFVVPVTGASVADPGTQVLLRNTVNGANIVDASSQALGAVADFLIDPKTGEFAYAVFNGGPLFNNRIFMVPVQNLSFNLDTASASGLGDIILNLTPDLLSKAPMISDLNQLMLDPALLQQLNDFWKMQNNTK